MSRINSIIFATGNPNKAKEVRLMLPEGLTIKTLKDLNYQEDIEETGKTIEENAHLKSQCIYDQFGQDVMAEDTGLIVPALNGAPGVYSARYAGVNATSEQNIQLLLDNLQNYDNRSAYFKTVFSVIINGQQYQFSGELHGTITKTPQGSGGFGYDPIFKANNYSKTLAEIEATEKAQISHRGKALSQVIEFLHTK